MDQNRNKFFIVEHFIYCVLLLIYKLRKKFLDKKILTINKTLKEQGRDLVKILRFAWEED